MSLASCTKSLSEEIKNENISESPKSEASILTFDSKEELEDVISKLVTMSEEQQQKWYESKGNFISQENYMWSVIEQLDKARTLDQVRDIQGTNADKLLFNNDPTDEDISPYIPSNNKGYSLVCNEDGDVIVNGVTVNFNNLNSYEETDFAINSRINHTRSETKENCAYAEGNRRKFWAEARRYAVANGNSMVFIEFTAHAKNMFGWNKYKTSYVVEYVSHDPATWSHIHNGIKEIIANRIIETRELASHSLISVGETPKLNNTTWRKGVMTFYVYSRGVGIAGRQILKINIIVVQ